MHSQETASLRFRQLEKEINDFSFTVDNKIVINTFFIVRLYAIWETSIKDWVYDTYKSYTVIFHQPNFVYSYMESVFSNANLREKFKANINNMDFEVKREYLTQSNNVNRKVTEAFFRKFDFDFNKVGKELDNSKKIGNLIEELNSLGVSPILQQVTAKPTEKVFGYIQLVVDERNQISHVFKNQFGSYNKEQMLALLFLVEELVRCIFFSSNHQLATRIIKQDSFVECVDSLNMNRNKRAKDVQFVICGRFLRKMDTVNMILCNDDSVHSLLRLEKVTTIDSDDEIPIESLVIESIYNFHFYDLSKKGLQMKNIGGFKIGQFSVTKYEPDIMNFSSS